MSDVTDVVVDVIVDDGDIIAISLDLLFLEAGLCLLPFVIDVGNVEVRRLVTSPHWVGS